MMESMWSSVFADTINTQVHLSSQLKLKLRRKRRIKITTSIPIKIRYANTITVMIYILFKSVSMRKPGRR